MASSSFDTISECSEASTVIETNHTISTSETVIDGADVQKTPDRHGFFGGVQYSHNVGQRPSPDTVLRRERKWLKMLSQWNFYMDKNYRKIRERCRKGIPMSVRPRAWLYLCGGKLLLDKHPNKYEELLNSPNIDKKCIDDIRKDIHRQFPTHEMFSSHSHKVGANGQEELFNLLKAYTVYNPVIGYCQAQAPIGAFLLMHMPTMEAFWCFVSICDKYLENYYSPQMDIIQRDGLILQGLLKKFCPPAYKHLKHVNCEPMYYCTEWFLCIFTRTLPWDTLLRIWDIFLCEGVKILFKIALVILIGCFGTVKSRKQCPGLCETLHKLRNPPSEILSEDNLIFNINRLAINERDFQLEHQKQTLRMKNANKR